jgi:hypothetical protein
MMAWCWFKVPWENGRSGERFEGRGEAFVLIWGSGLGRQSKRMHQRRFASFGSVEDAQWLVGIELEILRRDGKREYYKSSRTDIRFEA